jgi:hypothetical protein
LRIVRIVSATHPYSVDTCSLRGACAGCAKVQYNIPVMVKIAAGPLMLVRMRMSSDSHATGMALPVHERGVNVPLG